VAFDEESDAFGRASVAIAGEWIPPRQLSRRDGFRQIDGMASH
jgi:hypothetical protein